MIIEALMTVIYNVMNTLLVFNIPKLPDGVMEYVDTAFDYMATGAGILANYTPLGYLLTLFGVLLAVDVAIVLYHLVMWILRKIPMAGIS